MAEEALTEEDAKSLLGTLAETYGNVRVIQVRSNPRAIIVKTTNAVAPLLREPGGKVTLGGKALVPVMTSGSIGKLKKRATGTGSTEHGEVP